MISLGKIYNVSFKFKMLRVTKQMIMRLSTWKCPKVVKATFRSTN